MEDHLSYTASIYATLVVFECHQSQTVPCMDIRQIDFSKTCNCCSQNTCSRLLCCKSSHPISVTQCAVEIASLHIAIYHKTFHDVGRGHPALAHRLHHSPPPYLMHRYQSLLKDVQVTTCQKYSYHDCLLCK